MPLTATRLETIRGSLHADLQRSLARINEVLGRIAPHVPNETHISFDVHSDRITVEGEGRCFQNLDMLARIANEFDVPPRVHWIADGWDGEVMTPHPDFISIWVTNISDPMGPRPEVKR